MRGPIEARRSLKEASNLAMSCYFPIPGYHDYLFLSCLKNWKELCGIMRVLSGFAVGEGKKLNGGLLNIQANESEAASDQNNERNQKNRQWSAGKEMPQSFEGFLISSKNKKYFDSSSYGDSPVPMGAFFTFLVNCIGPRRKNGMLSSESDIILKI